MKIFSKNQYELFKQLARLRQKHLRKLLVSYLKKKYGQGNVCYTQDYIYATGDIPIALVAHMDTVHKQIPTDIFFDKELDAIWSPQGLGADDRAGVFAILQIIKDGFRPHIIFTADEELGCIGAGVLSLRPCPFDELKYIIELDRRGEKDCVFYDCINEPFIDYVETFGFEMDWGTFSDISELCPAWEVAGVNLSVGYFDEHSFTETLKSSFLLETIEKTEKMLSESEIPFFEYVPYVPTKNSKIPMAAYGYDYGYLYDVKCAGCGNIFYEEETFPVKRGDNETVYYCPDCVTDNVNWCSRCMEPFEKTGPFDDRTICSNCRDILLEEDNI